MLVLQLLMFKLHSIIGSYLLFFNIDKIYLRTLARLHGSLSLCALFIPYGLYRIHLLWNNQKYSLKSSWRPCIPSLIDRARELCSGFNHHRLPTRRFVRLFATINVLKNIFMCNRERIYVSVFKDDHNLYHI